MRYASTLAVLWLMVVTACAVDPAPRVEEDTLSSTTAELSSEGATEDDLGAATNATCINVWECDQICSSYSNGVYLRYSTSVKHRECDDGTDTVLLTMPCGTECY